MQCIPLSKTKGGAEHFLMQAKKHSCFMSHEGRGYRLLNVRNDASRFSRHLLWSVDGRMQCTMRLQVSKPFAASKRITTRSFVAVMQGAQVAAVICMIS